MSHRHLIRLLDDERAHWFVLDRAGRVLSGPQQGLPATPAEETLVLVPSREVLLLEAPRVARQRRQLERALPFAIEDQLVAPVEQAHVAVLDDSGTSTVAVAVLARFRLDAWQARLAEHGIVPERLLPEACLLPHESGPTLLLDGATATLRHARAGVLSGTPDEVPDWLALLAEQGETRPVTLVADARPDTLPAWAAGLRLLSAAAGTYLAERMAEVSADGMNLLTGAYTPKRHGVAGGRVWAWAAGLAMAGIGIAALSMAVERWQLDREYAQRRTQMEALLRETLPDVQRIVDPRAQMLGELSRRTGQSASGGALAMIGKIAPLLSGSGRYTLDAIEYRGGTLDITLRGTDVATLDELRERIASLGYSTELTSMVPGSSGVEGKLRVRGGGA
ncbi:type II secretion system protein GspL [Xanthomonadaceae bacterium JHOS43]|nr:type II secretion system protein GspL [Xanthomonadaceae bacterium JHOS43]